MKTMSKGHSAQSRADQCFPLDTQYKCRKRHAILPRLHAAKGIISLFVAFSALTGYVVKAGALDSIALHVFLAILLLAAGSATLNNLQDRKIDRLFSRTSQRPLACGALSVAQGKLQAICLLIVGSLLLFLAPHGALILLLGLTAVASYNLLYTPFKLRSLWSVIPGVLCGMIPPLIGWVAAGGHFGSPQIWLIMVLLGLWQPPHAWMILLTNADEFRASGSRNILTFFSNFQVGRIVFAWVCSFMATLILLPLFGILHHSIFSITLVLAGLLMTGCYAWGLFIIRTSKSYQHLFILLNSVLALAMLFCILENTIGTTFV